MTSPASLIKRFLDLLLMDTAHSSSAPIMKQVVTFLCCLLAQIISNPVEMMVMVARENTSSALSCSDSDFSWVRWSS